ncbi:hypothetical protein IQE94_10925 [Synechocystis sp. PCC 7339]|uniref:hypothetical protein n=1 Tax=Synechocystis sp. PCC 7339 TaxID=2782213 RepID=UPI001CBEC23F|nr:hypothetical protein [Synechocystis sp. PCC 7339]UAJ71651.1 hypothetical protein IQE94_10925 [Synechocystis sp. PCC 7339]
MAVQWAELLSVAFTENNSFYPTDSELKIALIKLLVKLLDGLADFRPGFALSAPISDLLVCPSMDSVNFFLHRSN